MIDLVAALELGDVELAERPLEAPVDILRFDLSGLGRGLSAGDQAESSCDDESFAQHRAQTFWPSPDNTGVEMESGRGSGVSRHPVNGRIGKK